MHRNSIKKLKNIPYYFSDKKSVPATYESLSDYRKNLKKMEYYADNFRMEKAGGGIAGIRRPNAIPPESGPTPYGLPSMLNRVKKVRKKPLPKWFWRFRSALEPL